MFLITTPGKILGLLLLGILLVVVGLHEDSSPVIAVGFVSLLGGVVLLVLKIVRRNQM